MKKGTKTKQKKAVTQRNTYTAEHREKSRKYYLIGLNLHEVSKLMDNIPVRTLEKWQISEKWTAIKEVQPIKLRALELHRAGRSYNEIAEILKINRVTVWRYLKEAKATKE